MASSNPVLTICIKIGGNALKDTTILNHFLDDCAVLRHKDIRMVLIHGGGPAIAHILDRYEIPHEFVGGHRKTSPEAVELVEMALKGRVGGALVRGLIRRGIAAAGISGTDGPTVFSQKRFHRDDDLGITTDLGQVGDVRRVDTHLIAALWRANILPVLAPLALAKDGTVHNVNADMFAAHVAAALKADLFFLLTDVDGYRRDKDDPASLLQQIRLPKDWPGIAGNLQGGMIPKMEAARLALEKGVGRVAILNGTKSGLLTRYLAGEQSGTTLTMKQN